MGKPFPLDFAPGIVKVDAPYALRGRYIDCDKIRFAKGKPEKHKGHVMFSAEPLEGYARDALGWDDFSFNRRLAVGTHTRLYLLDVAGEVQNITPFVSEGTLLTDPFAVTNGSAVVVVTHASHGVEPGQVVYFSNATAGGGITIDGEYVVGEVIGLNSYEITHSVPATSTDATTGGAAVAFSYELPPGNANVSFGQGWGIGPWNAGTWGTPRTSSTYIQYARTWALDLYGENLLAMPSGERLYQWDPDAPADRAALVTNSPAGHFMFVTSERYPVVLCADDEMMTLRWPDQNDITIWTPAVTNTALIRRLQSGSRLVAGTVLVRTLSILWTDSSAYSMQYTGRRTIIYETLLIGEKCGLIGPKAFAVANGVAYWMSNFNFHRSSGGAPDQVPNAEDIRDWLFGRLSKKQNWKCSAIYQPIHNEIRWQYILDGENESMYYVAVCLDDFSWTFGTDNRSVFEDVAGISSAVYGVDSGGNVYTHEMGLDANGEAMPWFLESAPIDIEDGDALIDMHGYIPNFQRQTGDIEVTINGYDHPQQTTPIDTFTDSIAEGQGIVDMNMSGRQLSVRLASEALGGDFRLGMSKVEVQVSGRRRASAA